jgi:hypothetical protein
MKEKPMTVEETTNGGIALSPNYIIRAVAAFVRLPTDEGLTEARREELMPTFIAARNQADELVAEVKRLRAELDDYKSGRPFATEALTKLARVEDWYRRTNSSDHDELLDAMDELGNKILKGDQ